MAELTELEQVLPQEIEKRSFEIITQELGDRVLDEKQAPVIKRVIHTTADFDYADNLVFSPNVMELAWQAIREGTPIITDTNMGKSGINKKRLANYGSEVYCFMADEDVAEEARKHGITRACASMDKAARLGLNGIFAIGFVNVVQAKELILTDDVPYIVARGRKGGSNVAAAICNALVNSI